MNITLPVSLQVICRMFVILIFLYLWMWLILSVGFRQLWVFHIDVCVCVYYWCLSESWNLSVIMNMSDFWLYFWLKSSADAVLLLVCMIWRRWCGLFSEGVRDEQSVLGVPRYACYWIWRLNLILIVCLLGC